MKKVLLIVAENGFQTVEYRKTKEVLEQGNVNVFTASNNKVAFSNIEEEINVDVNLKDVDINDYDGVFFIGGPGALNYLDNEVSYKIIQNLDSENKLFGAICISPRILANAGVLKDRTVTGWNEDGELEIILKANEAIYENKGVVVDDNLITADGRLSAEQFAREILKQL